MDKIMNPALRYPVVLPSGSPCGLDNRHGLNPPGALRFLQPSTEALRWRGSKVTSPY